MGESFGEQPYIASGTVHSIVLSVSIIIQRRAGTQIGSASGFFYRRGEDWFLVTNRHVMRDDDARDEAGKPRPIVPDTFQLVLHTNANDLAKKGEINLPLYNQKQQPLWKTHTKQKSADVALLKLERKKMQQSFAMTTWSREDFVPANYPLFPSEDVFVMGYPMAFHDTAHNFPIFRNAMIASVYGVPFQGKAFFLIDANLHPGTSGSPVITKPKNTRVDDQGNVSMSTGVRYHLVGVHSGNVTMNVPGGGNFGLSAAWYAQLVEDIAAEFSP